MAGVHHYHTRVTWTGNRGEGTASYRAYGREHDISAPDKLMVILGSSDSAFRGDPTRYNPEELLVASLSGCHMLWYLHLCAEAGVVVAHYADEARGVMVETADGGGQFEEVVLQPLVRVAEASMLVRAAELHERANELCFIARSCNFPVRCAGRFEVEE